MLESYVKRESVAQPGLAAIVIARFALVKGIAIECRG